MRCFLCWIVFVATTLVRKTDTANETSEQICEKPGFPMNGNYQSRQETFKVGQFVVYSCSAGFVLFGQKERTCLRDGTWSGAVPFCDRKTMVKDITTLGWERNDRALLDTDTSTCLSQNRVIFTYASYTIYLHRPLQVNALRVFSKDKYNDVKVLVESRSSSCSPITHLVPEWNLLFCQPPVLSVQIELQVSQLLNFKAIICEVEVYATEGSTCDPPTWNVVHGEIVLNRTATSVHCDSGYLPKDDQVLNCTDGEWKGEPPSCVEIPDSESDERRNLAITVSASSVVGAVILLVLGLAVFVILRRWRGRKRVGNVFLRNEAYQSNEDNNEYSYVVN